VNRGADKGEAKDMTLLGSYIDMTLLGSYNELRELADIVEQTGKGEAKEMTLLGSYIDDYHHDITTNDIEEV
jgi:hypothetical protein